MPYNNVKEAKKCINNSEAILIIAGAGMSVDSGIFTYRGNNGIWNKSIRIGNEDYRYDENALFNQPVTFRNNQGQIIQVPISALVDKKSSAAFSAGA